MLEGKDSKNSENFFRINECSVLKAAQEYCSMGIPIFPLHGITEKGQCTCGKFDCKHPGKHPRTQHGFKDATVDFNQFRRLVGSVTVFNLGMPTGRVSGIYVLDSDVRNGGDVSRDQLFAEVGGWTTRTVQTGGGQHECFLNNGDLLIKNRNGALPGIDLKTDLGYVVVPPSLHHSGIRYKFLSTSISEFPERLVKLLDEAAEDKKKKPISQAGSSGKSDETSPSKRQFRARRYLEKVPGAKKGEAGDDFTYQKACKLIHGFGLSEAETFFEMNKWSKEKCSPPWPEDLLRVKIQNAAKYGQSDNGNSAEGNDTAAGDEDNSNRRRLPSEVFSDFFVDVLQGAKRDILTGNLMLKKADRWVSVATDLDILESIAIDRGLKRNQIGCHLARHTESFSPEILVDIPEWDGLDRIRMIAAAITCSNLERKHVYEFLADWGSKMFLRFNDPRLQNRVLIFKGPQGAGKDALISAMVDGLGQFVSDVQLIGDSKDTLIALSELLVTRISEFDKTSRAEVAFLKDLITRDHIFVRLPYGKAFVHRELRGSFIASVNVDDFLRDHTGARRFIVIDVSSIDWSLYPRFESAQVLAQFKKLSEKGYHASKEAEDALKSYLEVHSPSDPKEAILELFDNGGGQIWENLTLSEIRVELVDIAKAFGISLNRVLNTLKANGRARRTNTGMRYSRKKQTVVLSETKIVDAVEYYKSRGVSV